jgi:hypothetical protein
VAETSNDRASAPLSRTGSPGALPPKLRRSYHRLTWPFMTNIGGEVQPSAPVSRKPAGRDREIPIEVRTSFWIWVVGALLNVVPIIAMLKNWRARINEILFDSPTLTPAEAEEQAWMTIWISVSFYVLIALLFIVCATRMRAGRRWARILLPILAFLNIAPVVVSDAGRIDDHGSPESIGRCIDTSESTV